VHLVSRNAEVDGIELTSLEPAFAFTEMKAFRAVRTRMAPAAFDSIRALHAWGKCHREDWEQFQFRLTIFEPVAGCLLCIASKRSYLFWAQHIIV
jgi:hypothetical protein